MGCRDGMPYPVRREGEGRHWCGYVRVGDEWGREGGGGGACPWRVGQGRGVRGLFVYCHGQVRARVRLDELVRDEKVIFEILT